MAENSKIEWTDHTINLWWGCSKVHTGCKNCYAEKFSDNRLQNNLWGSEKRRMIKSAFVDLDRYQKAAARQNKKFKIFVGSMMDIFEESHELENPFIGKEFKMNTTSELRTYLFFGIHFGKYPNLNFLFLSKRPELIIASLPIPLPFLPPDNVWFGVSVSDQKTANQLIPELLKVQYANLFLSVEPQVGPIDLTKIETKKITLNALNPQLIDGEIPFEGRPERIKSAENKIKWVIQGGESGPKRRPFDIDWATDMKKQCEENEVPYFFKQIDKKQPIPEENLIRQYPLNLMP